MSESPPLSVDHPEEKPPGFRLVFQAGQGPGFCVEVLIDLRRLNMEKSDEVAKKSIEAMFSSLGARMTRTLSLMVTLITGAIRDGYLEDVDLIIKACFGVYDGTSQDLQAALKRLAKGKSPLERVKIATAGELAERDGKSNAGMLGGKSSPLRIVRR